MSATTLMIALASILQSPTMPSAQWKPFKPPRGNFRIIMPGEPVESLKSIDTDDGPVDQRVFTTIQGGTRYTISYYDRPVTAPAKPPAEVLEAVEKRVVGNLQGKLITQNEVDVSGHPGKDLVVETPTANRRAVVIVKTRVYVVDRRIFQVMTSAYKTPTNKNATNDPIYFKSFKLTEPGDVPSAEAKPAKTESSTEKEEKKPTSTSRSKAATATAKSKPASKGSRGSAKIASTAKSKGKTAATKGDQKSAGMMSGLFAVMRGDSRGETKKPAVPNPTPLGGLAALLSGGKPAAAATPTIVDPADPQAPPGFKPFHDVEREFTVLMPGEPKRQSVDVPLPSAIGRIDTKPRSMKTTIVSGTVNNIEYIVTCLNNPSRVPDGAADAFFIGLESSFFLKAPGKFVKKEAIIFRGRAARNYWAEWTDASGAVVKHGRLRVILTADRSYIVSVATRDLKISLDDQMFFLDSFRLDAAGAK